MTDPAARCAPPPATDPAWTAYGDTILELRAGDMAVRVDLRRRLAPGVRDALVTLCGGRTFGVVTPENPGGRTLDDVENAARVRALGDELARAGLQAIRADGHGASSDHVEHGFAVVTDEETLRGIAGRTEQTAFYWFDGDRMWLVPTRPDEAPVALPTTPDALAEHLEDDTGDA
jgi:hypothetical protein